jgi:hypothetical protein
MKSYSGRTQTAALGVVLHFVIALGAATAYYLASRKFWFLVHRAIFVALGHGVAGSGAGPEDNRARDDTLGNGELIDDPQPGPVALSAGDLGGQAAIWKAS